MAQARTFALSILYRGVAQLIARSVWDREVEGLSPFTPTKKRVEPCARLFSWLVRA